MGLPEEQGGGRRNMCEERKQTSRGLQGACCVGWTGKWGSAGLCPTEASHLAKGLSCMREMSCTVEHRCDYSDGSVEGKGQA